MSPTSCRKTLMVRAATLSARRSSPTLSAISCCFCDRHHRVIDVEAVAEHPDARLLEMKARHEARIEAVTGIDHERRSHVVLYGARIGEHDYPVRFDLAKAA